MWLENLYPQVSSSWYESIFFHLSFLQAMSMPHHHHVMHSQPRPVAAHIPMPPHNPVSLFSMRKQQDIFIVFKMQHSSGALVMIGYSIFNRDSFSLLPSISNFVTDQKFALRNWSNYICSVKCFPWKVVYIVSSVSIIMTISEPLPVAYPASTSPHPFPAHEPSCRTHCNCHRRISGLLI